MNPAKLTPLLYALVAAELLIVQDSRFSNTSEADTYLVQGRPTYMAGSKRAFYSDIWQALLKTADSIRAGAPQHKHNFYDMSEDEMVTFFRGQHFNTVAAGEQLARIYDLSRFAHMLDVGTGSGGIPIGLARSGVGLRMTAIDLPRVIPATRLFLAEAGITDRILTSVVDVVAAAPEGTYDVAVVRNLLQVLSLTDAQAVVRHIAQSLAQDGTILIIGSMLEDTRLTPANLVGLNLVFLNIYDDGLIYTEGEYRGLLVAAGFVDIAVRRGEMPAGNVLISARKAWCQSARKRDPVSASKRDPTCRGLDDVKDVSLFGRERRFLRPGLTFPGRRAQPRSRMAAGHRRRRRAASLTAASTTPGLDRTGIWRIRRGS